MPEHAAVDGYLLFGQIALSFGSNCGHHDKSLRMGKLWSQPGSTGEPALGVAPQCSGCADFAIASICELDSSSSSVFVTQYSTLPWRQPTTWMCEPSSTNS
jgi:hypothetical protein